MQNKVKYIELQVMKVVLLSRFGSLSCLGIMGAYLDDEFVVGMNFVCD